MTGVALVLGIMILAGVIAYIGDRVGHQVGRKRLTLFGLRPKYTSTIVAVGTGMTIALVVTLAALVASSYVRTAFFRIGQLNAQLNQLQAQALSQSKELETTRSEALVMRLGQPIAPFVRIFDVTRPEDALLSEYAAFFDETVRYANSTLTRPPAGLRAYEKKSSDPEVRALLRRDLESIREQFSAPGGTPPPALLIPVAAQNLFRGDRVSFAFAHYADRKVASAGETIATVDVTGGTTLNLLDTQVLYNRAAVALAGRGFPSAFLIPPNSGLDSSRLGAIDLRLARERGRYRLVAKPTGDVFPHNTRVLLTIALEPAR